MNDVLTKPIRRHTLLSAVDRWISVKDEMPVRSGDSLPFENVQTSPQDVMPIDYHVALEEFGDEDVVNDVVDQFLEKVETQIQDMKEALSAQDVEALRRNAHAIKGGAATLEAKPLAGVAKQMEHLCKSHDVQAIPSALENVIAEFDRLRIYVESSSQS
jgi:HPt (histidine-containing phosphotransfer) domain-containing protein